MSALSPDNPQTKTTPICELKGSRFTLSVLHLRSTDLEAIEKQLSNLLSQAPGFLEQAPVVLEVTQMTNPEKLDLGELTHLLHRHTLIPVALRGGNEPLRTRAAKAGLALLPETQTLRGDNKVPEPRTKKSAPPASERGTRIVTRPVRSGQQIYAEGTDLVILGAVSPGAEVIADGHIHIYGALRGRALAGARGDESARIFCQSLEAELLSIAGNYRVLETQPEEARGRTAHAWLQDERLMIEML